MHKLWKMTEKEMIDITPLISGLKWSSNVDALGVQLSFSFANSKTTFFPEIPLTVGDHILLENNGYEIYRGVIITEQRKGQDVKDFTSFDYAFYLNKSKAVYQFNTTASQAIKRICSDFDIPMGSMAYMPTWINKIYKDKELSKIMTDILELAHLETSRKYIMEMVEGKLDIRPEEELRISETIKLADNLSPVDVVYLKNSPSRKLSIDGMKNKVVAYGEDKVVSFYKKDFDVSKMEVIEVKTGEKVYANILAQIQDMDLINKYGLLVETVKVDKKDQSKAYNMAKNLLKKLGRVLEDNSITLIGNDKVRSGRLIAIEEPLTGMSGWYRIKACTHNLANTQHTMNLTLEVVVE